MFALALVWYGLMVVLLAVKVSPHTVNALSGYRTLYHDAAGLTENDFSTGVRFIAGIGGLVAFVVFLYLALQELPRPYLARGEVQLQDHEHGDHGGQTQSDRADGRARRARQRQRDLGLKPARRPGAQRRPEHAAREPRPPKPSPMCAPGS